MSSIKVNELLDLMKNEDYILDEAGEKMLHNDFDKVTKTIVKAAKRLSKQFSELFYSANYPDSYQDGLRVQAFSSEFILNIVFKQPSTGWKMMKLGDDVLKPNRAVIHIPKRGSSETWNNLLIQDDEGKDLISPQIMARIMYDAVDLALGEVNNKISTYTVTRSEDSPDLLIAEGPKLKFSVRLVVGFQLQMKHLKTCPELKQRVEHILAQFSIESKTFRAIVSEENDKFEISFPDIEREILTLSGCAQDVITAIKLWVLHTGTRMTALWSSLLQTSLIQHAIEKKSIAGYWDRENLAVCLADCVNTLFLQLQKDSVIDIFFPQTSLIQHAIEKKLIAGYWDRENLAVCLADCVNTLFLQLQKDSVTDIFFPQINVLDCAEKQDVKDATLMVRKLRNLCQSKGEHSNNERVAVARDFAIFHCDPCGRDFDCEENLKQHKEGVEHMLQEVLANKQTSPEDDDDLNPGERAKALDQGDASICTMYAVANATVESLTEQDIDISLQEFVGGLKQFKQLDLVNGNNVEEFNNVIIKNMTDKKSKKYGNIILDVEGVQRNKTKQKQYAKFVIVYNQVIGDPKTKHAVFLKSFQSIDGSNKMLCINSHGDVNPVILVDPKQLEQFYSVVARWTPVKNTESNPLVTAVTRDININININRTETSPSTSDANYCFIS